MLQKEEHYKNFQLDRSSTVHIPISRTRTIKRANFNRFDKKEVMPTKYLRKYSISLFLNLK
jgi:hypothetical protein